MRSIIQFFIILVFAQMNVTGHGRQKRQSFDFSMNTGDSDADWDAFPTAKTLTAPPPPFHVWNVGGQGDSTTDKPNSETSNSIGESGNLNTQGTTSPPTNKTPAAEVDPALGPALGAPESDMFCSPNLCLYFPSNCLPHQECAMDADCNDMVCIDTNKPLPTADVQQNESDTTTEARNDCPVHMKRCLVQNSQCLATQECVMNANCTDVICIDRHTSTPSHLTTHETTFQNNCSLNLCVEYSRACTADEDCYMDSECKLMHCVNRNSRQIQTSTPYDVSESPAPSISTLRHESERKCNSYITCIHGYCSNETGTCKCDKGWDGLKCNLPCTLDCVHGTCYVYINISKHKTYVAPEEVTLDIMKCNCHYGWKPPLCNERFPDLIGEAKRRTLKLGFSLGAMLLVVIVTSIVALTVMWHKRVILVMKLVYFFKLEEDHDGRVYDAYISMGSSTQGINFVKNQLCPMLENSGFRLYVHARDRPIGEVVSNSILKVMEQSRRTILIITSDYLKNEWGKFECITAQIQTLKLHQRIIPIILEDVSKDGQAMDRTLRHILDSVKCLKYPKLKDDPSIPLKEMEALKDKKVNKFWKRLELTMPKKGKQLTSTSSETEITDFDNQNVKPIDITFTDMYSIV